MKIGVILVPFILGAGLGFLSGCWFYSLPPSSGPLKYLNTYSQVLATYVQVKNSGDKDIHLEGARLFVTSVSDFKPPSKEPPVWACVEREPQICLNSADNPSKNEENLSFFTKDCMTIFSDNIEKLRVRIRNKDFPGVSVTGNLWLYYKDDRGNKYSLEIRGVTVDIESW